MMAEEVKERGITFWNDLWDRDAFALFHQLEVHKMLQKHSSLLFKEGEPKKIFVPLCGKTLDMKWFLDQGHTVIGLDGVKKAVEDFFKEHNLEVAEDDAPNLGSGCQVLKVKDGSLKLYFGNMLDFNISFEGQFDCIWDRGSMVALDIKDSQKYVAILKEILRPGGKIFVEVIQHDKALFEGMASRPPAHPVFEDELRELYEPDCTVERIDKDKRLLRGKEVDMVYYLIVKK